jgi:CubicO group peptidase (beta-lactamase class C family)
MKKGMIKIAFILIVVSLLVNPGLYGKKSPGKIDLKGFSKFVESMLTEWEVPGAAVAIVKDGKVVFARGFRLPRCKE